MKFMALCFQCAFSNGVREKLQQKLQEQPQQPAAVVVDSWGAQDGQGGRGPATPGRSALLAVELEDGAYYETTCGRGHREAMILTACKFEILFESGALALLDGYKREAVSTFSVALERFYEHWVKTTLLQAGATAAVLKEAWKDVAAQSERQLGAFVLLHLRETGKPPQLPPTRWTEFRNRVVHKGYVPTRDETFEYGDVVLGHTTRLYKDLYDRCLEGLLALRTIELDEARTRAHAPERVATFEMGTIFSLVAGRMAGHATYSPAGEKGIIGFSAALAELEAKRRRFRELNADLF